MLFAPLQRNVLESSLDLVRQPLGVEVRLRVDVECAAGWDADQRRRRADLILAGCVAPHRQGTLAVGVLADDLYVPNLNFVFGLADANQGAAVVSWYRLATPDTSRWALRLAKEIVHEVGHLRGLAHCRDPRCVMHFSNTLADTDAKDVQFCARCGPRWHGAGATS